MTAKEFALIAAAGIAFNGALYLLWIAYCEFMRARERRKRAREAAAARRASEPAAARQASHEAAELTAKEELLWERITSRNPNLGKDVIR